ncbi:serine hydrolase [uncultured Lactobacillus sp.]|uniref:serine hydrolase n=1 Tax=uncultured Lactobacillus sp. TaxID=153152 RepID=UPI00260FD5FD|nr:serine hydrolase [uncultured Lactobacillus sp.]
MKHNVFLGAALASFCALAFYITSTNRMANKTIKVYGNGEAPYSEQKKFTNKDNKPASSTDETDLALTVSKKSNSSLAKVITKQLNNPVQAIQVSAIDLRSDDVFANVQNSSKSLNVSNMMKLFLLIAYEKQVADHHLNGSQTYTVKAGDLKGADALLAPNMGYSYTYLVQLMMNKNDNNAANIILKKIGKDQVNKIIEKAGAKNTHFSNDFHNEVVGTTTAQDLSLILKKLYQGKVINSGSDNKVLGNLLNFPDKGLATSVTGTIYKISDKYSSAALVQSAGKTYVMTSVSHATGFDFGALGKQINGWFMKN